MLAYAFLTIVSLPHHKAEQLPCIRRCNFIFTHTITALQWVSLTPNSAANGWRTPAKSRPRLHQPRVAALHACTPRYIRMHTYSAPTSSARMSLLETARSTQRTLRPAASPTLLSIPEPGQLSQPRNSFIAPSSKNKHSAQDSLAARHQRTASPLIPIDL